VKTSNHAAVAAVALSCLFAAAVPGAAFAEARDAVQVRVSTRGLDLHTKTGRHAFETRIVRAARAACIPNGATLGMRIDALRCLREMREDGTRQLAALAGDDVRFASLPRADRKE
jgi:UrcA family protein